MKKLSDFFYKQANGYLVLAFLAAQFTFSGVILPYFQKQFDPELNRGLMDLSFGFSAEKGYNILESYGEKGREVYFFVESFIDVIYPITYTIAFILLLSFLFKKNNLNLGLLNLLPLGCLIFDLGENFGIVKMLKAFPERVDFWASFSSNVGMVKWVFAALTVLIVLGSLLMWSINALRKR
jgi:hypothetical protein